MKKFDWDYVKPEKVAANVRTIALDIMSGLLSKENASEKNYYMIIGVKMLNDAIVDSTQEPDDDE